MDDQVPPASPQRSSSAVSIGVGIAILVVAVAAIIFWFVRKPNPAPPAPPPPPAAVAANPAPPDMPLPSTEESDARVRRLFAPLSANPAWPKWLEQPGLLERGAVVIDNVVEDVSPRKQLGFLAPETKFEAKERGGKLLMEKTSSARYDTVGDVIGSLDAKALAQAFHELHPLLESAYHALGYPDRPLDGVVGLALKRLANAPVVEEVEVRRDGRVYRFADPKLEEQGPIEKQLLRMGPRNTRLISAKARELATALGMDLK